MAVRDMHNHDGKLLGGGQLTLTAAGLLGNGKGEISGESLTLAAQRLDNAQGKVVARQEADLTAKQGLSNAAGWLEGGNILTVKTDGDWDNQGGTAQGGRQVTASARSLDNTGGHLQSGGDLTLDAAGNILNRTGKLTAQQVLAVNGGATSLFDNDGGSLQSGGDLSLLGGQLTNRAAGVVLGGQALSLNLTGDWDNRGGTLTGNGRTEVRTVSLLNAQGAINALGSLDMQFTGKLDNSRGRIFSQSSQMLQAQEIVNAQGWMGSQASWQAISGGFDNTEGIVQSLQAAQIMADWLGNAKGVLQSAHDLALRIKQDIDNRNGKVSAQGQLAVTGAKDGEHAGAINNAGGQWLAGEGLRIAARALDNTQGGLLYSQKQQRLTLSDALNNRDGKVQSGEALQLDAQTLNNAGGTIDGQQQVALRILGLLENTGGAVRSNGGQEVSAAGINNTRGVFSSRGGITVTSKQLDNDGGTLISQGSGIYRLDRLNNQQGKLHSGDALTLEGAQVNNQGGQLVSTQGLTLKAEALDNSGQGTLSSQGAINLLTDRLHNRDGGLILGTTRTDITARDIDNTAGRLQSSGQMTLSGVTQLDNRQGRILADGNLDINAALSRTASPLALLNQGGRVETDERFTRRDNFISSDYMLERVGYDPAQAHKRLGDGFYEQRLVREQVLKLTGKPSIKGWDAMAQYQHLMNNGSKVAQDFHLMPGVALTPEQIAALQQDIVWLVSETVQTEDGPQTVWVPKVYLAQTTLRLTGDGAVIGGGDLQLSANSITNAGNLFADKALTVDAGQFLHQGGDIKAGSIDVQADSLTLSTNLQDALRQATMSAGDIRLSGTNITLSGAKLDATDTLSLSARNDLTITAAKSSHSADLEVISGSMGNRTRGGTEAAGSRMAHVSGEWQQARGSELNAGGNLTLNAGRDVTFTGSQAKAGGQLGVQAGGNINLLADKTTNTTHLNANSRTSSVSNDRQEERLTLSTLGGDQGVTLVAGNQLLAEGAQLDSKAGRIGLSAQDVTINDARTRTQDQDSENKREGKTQSHRDEQTERDISTGSTFSGQQGVTVIGREGDVTVTGSTLHSDQGAIALQAKKDVTLNHTTDSEHRVSSEESRGRKTKGERAEEVLRENVVGSTLSGRDGVTVVAQDGSISATASALHSEQGAIALQAKQDVTLNTATERESTFSEERSEKKGFLKQSSSHSIANDATTREKGSLLSGNSVSVNAGNDLTVSGSAIAADRDVNLQAGNNVDIGAATETDTHYRLEEKKKSGLLGSGGKLHSNFDSVKEQTGLFAGKGGYDVKVKEHTQLDGAVIASTADKEKNRLDTGTLGWTDIHNQADYSATHSGGSFSTGGPVGKDLLTNMAGGMLSGANNGGHAEGTTKAAVSEGMLIIRDADKQQQDVAQLNHDTGHANDGSISPIFNKEKEQNRLKQAQLIGEIATQAMDIAATQGKINGEKAKKDPAALQAAKELLADNGNLNPTEKQIAEQAYNTAMAPYGTGGKVQQAMQAATAAVQGLAGGNITQAITGAAAPYLAEVIHNMTTDPATGHVNVQANLMAHAVLGAVVAQASGNSALAGASGAAAGEFIAQQLYPGIPKEQLSEEQKQTISALGTLAAGLAGGVAGGSTANAVAGAQAGKNSVENNSLGLPSGLQSYGQAVASWDQYAETNGLTPEQKQAGLNKLAQGDMPEGANIPKVIIEAYKDGVLAAGAAYLGPAASAGKVVGGALIGAIANGSYQWFDISQPGNENKSYDYLGTGSAAVTGGLAPGRGIWQNVGIATGGAIFTDGPDAGAVGASAAGAWAGGMFGEYAPGVVNSVIGKELPGFIYDIGGAFASEAATDAGKSIINEKENGK